LIYFYYCMTTGLLLFFLAGFGVAGLELPSSTDPAMLSRVESAVVPTANTSEIGAIDGVVRITTTVSERPKTPVRRQMCVCTSRRDGVVLAIKERLLCYLRAA
jgi:hypothetical protein